MTLAALTAATAALQEAADAYNGKIPAIDAKVTAAQATYSALAEDLQGVVRREMYFTCTINPDEAAPTEVDGGTFASIADAVAKISSGGFAILELLVDKTYEIDNAIPLFEGSVLIRRKSGQAGNDPVVQFNSYTANAAGTDYNYCYGITPTGMVDVRFDSVTLAFQGKIDPAADWGYPQAAIRFTHTGLQSLGLEDCTVIGDVGLSLMNCNAGATVRLGLFNSTLDGGVIGVANAALGVALISTKAVTLSNGSTLTDGGVIGTNILQS